MNKIAVIFWTGTGNTEVMANEVVAGAKEAGADVTLFNTSAFSADKAQAAAWNVAQNKVKGLSLIFILFCDL